jgi:hypothetical protein
MHASAQRWGPMKWEDEVPCLFGDFLVIFLNPENVFNILHRQLGFIFLCGNQVSWCPREAKQSKQENLRHRMAHRFMPWSSRFVDFFNSEIHLPAWPESFASAYSTAFARHTEPISLSRFRTPDSLVYDSMILDMTSELNSTCPSPRPSLPRQNS